METLRLYRSDPLPDGCFGNLLRNNKEYCVTVENKDKLIPYGTYYATPFKSPANGRCFLLSDEPGGKHISERSMIEIHKANFGKQLKGCLAPGKAFGWINNEACVLSSGDTLERLLHDFPKGFMLEIYDASR